MQDMQSSTVLRFAIGVQVRLSESFSPQRFSLYCSLMFGSAELNCQNAHNDVRIVKKLSTLKAEHSGGGRLQALLLAYRGTMRFCSMKWTSRAKTWTAACTSRRPLRCVSTTGSNEIASVPFAFTQRSHVLHSHFVLDKYRILYDVLVILIVEMIGWAVVPLYVRIVCADLSADASDSTARRQTPATQTPASGGGQIGVTAAS